MTSNNINRTNFLDYVCDDEVEHISGIRSFVANTHGSLISWLLSHVCEIYMVFK